jgi:lipoic acid synthetase
MVGIGEREEEVEELMRDVYEGTLQAGISDDRPATNRDAFDTPDPNRNLPSGAELNRSVTGVAKPQLGEKLRRGGFLVDQSTNPYWNHTGPAKAPDASDTIKQLSFPAATYPGVHESCDILTIGQYLQPTRDHLPISHWVTPAQFVEYKRQAEAIGFRHCESGPLVRSSYHADDQVLKMETAGCGG